MALSINYIGAFPCNRKEAKDHGEGGVLVGAEVTLLFCTFEVRIYANNPYIKIIISVHSYVKIDTCIIR